LQKAGRKLLRREQVLGDRSITVVAVESDVKDHADDARAALEAGKHIHLEKSPTADMASFRRLIAIAREKRLVMQLGYMWRHNPGFGTILTAARKGFLGEIFMVRGTIHTLLPPDQRRAPAEFSGGLMFELGGHLIDPMVRLLGRPARITPALKKFGSFGDALADNTAALFEFRGALGIVASSALQPSATRHRSFEVAGTNGTAVLSPIEPPVLQLDLAKAAGPYAAGPQTIDLGPYRRYIADFVELAQAVQTGGPLCVTPEEDLMVHEALLAASGMLPAAG